LSQVVPHIDDGAPIHVVLAADRRCVRGCAVSIRSILENSRPIASFHFHLITSGVRARARDDLARTVRGSDRDAQVSFATFDTAAVRHLVRSRRISHTAYVRVFLGSLLPPQVRRCIYVDCDLLFERDIVELWETELGGRSAGAVDNSKWEDSELHRRRLGLREATYFNSGVLLVDLELWRKRKVDARALALAERLGDELILHDQDALNGALEGDWLPLSLHWNVWVIDPELQASARAIFHFMGWPKPWHADYSGRFADKFFRYLDETPFAGWRPWNPLGMGHLLRRARQRLPYLPSVARILRIRGSTPEPAVPGKQPP
jgi:lipopolysaccharide biosynthesis glycosyltransferase